MCDNCGCGNVTGFSLHSWDPAGHKKSGESLSARHEHHDHEQERMTEEGHGHHPHALVHDISVGAAILTHNDRLAERNRGFFSGRGITALNLVSSPGSGKTELLAATLDALRGKIPSAVLVGDLQTDNDAARLRNRGAPVVQINTGNVCHLDAEMIHAALDRIDLEGVKLLFIENVGNLVCPAAFDLGESQRIVLLSVTEGEDKPLKYPSLFHSASLVVITKTDMASAAGFDREAALANIHRIAHHARVLELSARTGAGMDAWINTLTEPIRG
jgi:hydrogenase nickel incorporation protein HypB